MSHYYCGPLDCTIDNQSAGRIVVLGGGSGHARNWIGKETLTHINRTCGTPPDLHLDILATFFSICAVDLVADRSKSVDGWTRELDMTIAVSNPQPFQSATGDLTRGVNFLTGDRWNISFISGPSYVQNHRRRSVDASTDCVSLLSGGMDSLVGLLDRVAEGRRPLAVSHVYNGDGATQDLFARSITPNLPHLKTSQAAHLPDKPTNPPSQRARSLAFLGLAIAAAGSNAVAANANGRKEVIMPENGFISLNPPLTVSRIGSHSTRTTHPIFLSHLSSFLNQIGAQIEISNPYQLKTKGEMIADCRNASLCRSLLGHSISCGIYRRNSKEHCGTCLPCLIRRSAFKKASITDNTPSYTSAVLTSGPPSQMSGSICDAIHGFNRYRQLGIKPFIGPHFGQMSPYSFGDLCSVASRGFNELGALLGLA